MLEKINSAEDIKKLNTEEKKKLEILCSLLYLSLLPYCSCRGKITNL